MPISIRARLTLTFTLVLALILAIANVALSYYSFGIARRRTDQALREGTKSLMRSLREEWDEAEEDQNSDSLGAVSSLNTVLPITAAIRHTRQELSEDRVDAIVVEESTGAIIRSDSGPSGLPWPQADRDGWQYKVTRVPAPQQSERYGTYEIAVGVPWRLTAAELAKQDTRFAALSTIFLALSAAGAWVLVGYTLRPIAHLAQQANTMRDAAAAGSAEQIQLRAPSPDSEVVGLVRTLNLLMDGIAESAAAKARFYTAASHELRTPLHVLCGRLELVLGHTRTAEEYREAIVDVQSQADRLTTIIESLLLLNRIDRGILEAPLCTVDIALVCSQMLEIFSPVIAERGLHVQMDSSPDASGSPILAVAPEMHVEIMTRNLIENALKYAPEGGHVWVRIASPASQAQSAELTVHNEADSIVRDAFERLFEPFYRPDDSRTAHTGGNGLGLSLCRALADADGWNFTLRQDTSGVTAHVAFGEAGE